MGAPATTVPTGLGPKGLPLAVQVIAGPERDALALAVAQQLEARGFVYAPPAGKTSALISRTSQGTFIYNEANATGIYHARWPAGSQTFAVNQFDLRESDLAPRGLVPEGTPEAQADAYKIKIGYNPVAGTRRTVQAPREWWKFLACLALGVVCLEWYIYNRRVYI